MLAVFIGKHISVEMLTLWAIEATISFALIFALLASGNLPSADHALDYVSAARLVTQTVVLVLTMSATAFSIGLYRPDVVMRTRRLLIDTAVAGLIAFPAVLLAGHVLTLNISFFSHDTFWALKMLIAWIALLLGTRLGFRMLVRMRWLSRRILVLDPERGAATALAVRTYGGDLLELAGVASAGLPPISRLRRARVRELVVGDTVRLSGPQLARLNSAGIAVRSTGEFWDRRLRRVDIERVPVDCLNRTSGPVASSRLLDVVASTVLLVTTLPVIALTALLVSLESAGPVLYRQERVGLHGRSFTLLKFRSMRTDAEQAGPTWATKRDPRVTRVGHILRKTRIDELPQLINILRGEMSFIGPRPERPHFVAKLAAEIPHYDTRTQVKPGLTGWAQVNYPYGASVEDARMKLSYDLYYVRNRSFLLDLLIIVATVRVILFQEGAR